MTRAFKLSCIALILSSASAQALTLDYRHEYKQDSKTQANRLKLSHTAPNGVFASVEGKMEESTKVQSDGFKEGNGSFSGSGSEWELGKNYVINDQLTLAPALNLDNGDKFVGYRAQIKAIYKLNENWVTTLRWRGGIQNDEDPNVANKNYNQFNWELGYANSAFSIMGDVERRFTNYDDYEGDNGYWLFNVTAAMPINKQWTPYTEVGYVPRYNTVDEDDEMEFRYRLGIKYNF